jgi:hypothetical protein
MLSCTTTWPIRILCYPPWYTKLQPSATRKVFQENWSSFIVHSKQNSYSHRQIHCAIHPSHMEDTAKEDLTSVASLPFAEPTFNHVSKVLMGCNFKPTGLHLEDSQFPLACLGWHLLENTWHL